MYTCKMCGRKFKTSQELAGHTSGAHPKAKANREDAPGNNPAEGVVVEAVPEETQQAQPPPSAEEAPGVMDRIRELYRKGYSPKKIKDVFGYHPRTVDQVGEEFIEPDAVHEDERHDGFPVTRKSGSGQEVMNPEVLLKQYLVEDGDVAGQWMFRGMMLLRAAQLMNMDIMQMRKLDAEADAKRLEPLMKMIQVSREEMDATAQRNRESMMETASAAAGEAAARAAAHIDQRFDQMQEKKKDIAEVQDPMKGLMARTMESMIQRMQGMMFGGGGQGGQQALPPAWKDERQGGS